MQQPCYVLQRARHPTLIFGCTRCPTMTNRNKLCPRLKAGEQLDANLVEFGRSERGVRKQLGREVACSTAPHGWTYFGGTLRSQLKPHQGWWVPPGPCRSCAGQRILELLSVINTHHDQNNTETCRCPCIHVCRPKPLGGPDI